jgi:PAS domain S-box-containing protein
MLNSFIEDTEAAALNADRLNEVRALVRAINRSHAVIEFDLDGVIINANDKFLAIMGYERAEVIGQPHNMLVSASYASSEEYRQFWERLARGEYFAGRYLRRCKNGDEVWIEGVYNPILDAEGKPYKIMKIFQDASYISATESALYYSEQNYRLIAEYTSDIIMRYDLEGRIEYISPACRMFGYEPKDMIGHPMAEFAHPDEIPVRNEVVAGFLEGQGLPEGQRNEFRVRRADGEWLWMEGSPSLIRDRDGKAIGVVTVIRDVTERRLMEQELRRKQAQAEAANRAKTDFLANMSHEIRTPLNGVIGLVTALAQSGLDTRQIEMLGIIETSAKTLQTLLNDLLDFAKIESGQFELNPEPMAPADLVRQIASLFATTAQEKGLSLDVEVDEEAANAVMADAPRLAQILSNLCSNAVKFTERGHVRLSVNCIPLGPRQRLRFQVSDTGIGISDQGQLRLFERFAQADSSITRRFGGSGLGLSISQTLAQAMGGEILVTSEEGRGSCFTLELEAPLCAPANRMSGALEAPLPGLAGAGDEDAPKLKVMLVEDHAVNRRVVQLIIGDLVDLTAAENGAEALELDRKETFDVILMDMQMPVMDGLTACRAIRERERLERLPRKPILMLTANAMREHMHACLDAGADAHLAKPVTAQVLLEAISKAIANRAATAPPRRRGQAR